ncbi:MAG: ABC transporter permease [Heliobacteriaceae bacterium]|jgi:ABC-2 type transport system permease protein|nr:ABC transporter permease [Heliobacteriaceae bacterium]
MQISNIKIIKALVKKEFYQIIRDPSSILIAFVIPLLLLVIYRFGINLDTVKVTMGIKNDDPAAEIQTLVKSFGHSEYIKSFVYEDKDLMYEDLVRSKLRGMVIIPNNFSVGLSRSQPADLLVITDGSETNLANYAQSYPQFIANQWLASSKYKYDLKPPLITPELRYWYNQDINSHYFIMPGSIAITTTLIGILLTALVIAREWERGTMEALLSTRVKRIHIVTGKYIPYFILGMLSMIFSLFVCIAVFKIPFNGSLAAVLAVGSLFLFTCIGVGLLISTNLKDQFLASQTALAVGFMPALMLSGLMFPINSMPLGFQWFTHIIPTRYFVQFILSEFLAGTVWEIVYVNSVFLLVFGGLLFMTVYKKTGLRLEDKC